MSKMKYIATLSGGKDSTVMCDLLLKNKYPVDKQGSLFDFSDEPLKDCFCKI